MNDCSNIHTSTAYGSSARSEEKYIPYGLFLTLMAFDIRALWIYSTSQQQEAEICTVCPAMLLHRSLPLFDQSGFHVSLMEEERRVLILVILAVLLKLLGIRIISRPSATSLRAN